MRRRQKNASGSVDRREQQQAGEQLNEKGDGSRSRIKGDLVVLLQAACKQQQLRKITGGSFVENRQGLGGRWGRSARRAVSGSDRGSCALGPSRLPTFGWTFCSMEGCPSQSVV
jgi:hypothetical protein